MCAYLDRCVCVITPFKAACTAFSVTSSQRERTRKAAPCLVCVPHAPPWSVVGCVGSGRCRDSVSASQRDAMRTLQVS